MDSTSSLVILRDFTIRRERPIVRDDLIMFRQLAFRKTARTNYLVDWFDYGAYHQPVRKYYTLDSVVFLLFNADLYRMDIVEYHRRAEAAGVTTEIRDSDWRSLLDYLNGKITSTTSVDFAFVPGPDDLPVPSVHRSDPGASSVAPALDIPPLPVPVLRRTKRKPAPIPIPQVSGGRIPAASNGHDPFMWLLVNGLELYEGPSDSQKLRRRIVNAYPVNKVFEQSRTRLKPLITRLINVALTSNIIQKVGGKPLRYQLSPGVNPCDFPVPLEMLRQKGGKKKRDEKQLLQPKTPKKKENKKPAAPKSSYAEDWDSAAASALPGFKGGSVSLLRNLVEDALRSTGNGKCNLSAVFEFTVVEAKRRRVVSNWDCAMVRTMLEVGLRLGFVVRSCIEFSLTTDIKRQVIPDEARVATETKTNCAKRPKVRPTISATDFIPAIASALRTLNNPTGSTAAEILRNIQAFFCADALRNATRKKLNVFIPTAVGLAVIKSVVEKAVNSNEIPFSERRFRLCSALASTCFRETAAVTGLRRTNTEQPKPPNDDCIIIDDEEVQGLASEHGEMWAVTDRALRALEKTGACSGQLIFGTVSMLKESESDEVSPWKYEDIEAVLLWGVRMGVYVKTGEQYRTAVKSHKPKIQDNDVARVMKADDEVESHIHPESEEMQGSDHGGLYLPTGVAGSSSVTPLQEAVAFLPSVSEISGIVGGNVGLDKDDCVIMEIENERNFTSPSQQVQNIEQVDLGLPLNHARSPSFIQSQEAASSAPSPAEIGDIVHEPAVTGVSDDSTIRAQQMAAYQSFAASVYR